MPQKRADLRARSLFSGKGTGSADPVSRVRLAKLRSPGGPRPAKRTPAQHRPRAPGSCADAIRTYCATTPRGARSHRTASPAPQGEGAWEERSDDRTHNAPYGRGGGRGAGGVTGGGRPAPAGCSSASGESLPGGGGAEPPGAIPCEASAVEFLRLRGGRFGVGRKGVILKL